MITPNTRITGQIVWITEDVPGRWVVSSRRKGVACAAITAVLLSLQGGYLTGSQSEFVDRICNDGADNLADVREIKQLAWSRGILLEIEA